MILIIAIVYLLIGVVISVLEFENIQRAAEGVIPDDFKQGENAIILFALILLVLVGPVMYLINLFRKHE